MALSNPSFEEVEKAKKSLKECLSDLFKLNLRERLVEALLTLSLAEAGLTADQQNSIETFQASFREFTADFSAFEQDNAEFGLMKFQKDELVSKMNRSHESYLSLKNLKDDLAREAEELGGDPNKSTPEGKS
ncbi:hypothetical protein MLD38_015976 [Melastoma candidum]|nr:hypothetical protein MLD38_015976 [Melastoma candidum]